MEDEATTPILTRLIENSAMPFNVIKTEFAADSSGFSACKFDRWCDQKYGSMKSEHAWVKSHALTGTSTHIFVAVIMDEEDSAHFPQLVKTTAQGFTIKKASADKACASAESAGSTSACSTCSR